MNLLPMYEEVYADYVLISEYEERRRCEGICCAVCHRENDDCFHIASEAADAGVGAQTVSCDVNREVFSG